MFKNKVHEDGKSICHAPYVQNATGLFLLMPARGPACRGDAAVRWQSWIRGGKRGHVLTEAAAASPQSFTDHNPPGEGLPALRAASAPRTTRRSRRALLMRDGVQAATFLLSQPTLPILETFQQKRQPGCSSPICVQTHICADLRAQIQVVGNGVCYPRDTAQLPVCQRGGLISHVIKDLKFCKKSGWGRRGSFPSRTRVKLSDSTCVCREPERAALQKSWILTLPLI